MLFPVCSLSVGVINVDFNREIDVIDGDWDGTLTLKYTTDFIKKRIQAVYGLLICCGWCSRCFMSVAAKSTLRTLWGILLYVLLSCIGATRLICNNVLIFESHGLNTWQTSSSHGSGTSADDAGTSSSKLLPTNGIHEDFQRIDPDLPLHLVRMSTKKTAPLSTVNDSNGSNPHHPHKLHQVMPLIM